MKKLSPFLKKYGCRIRNQLNGIKRPIDVASKELGLEETYLQKCVDGQLSEYDVNNIINKITKTYPIKLSNIYLEKDYTKSGVIYKSWNETEKTNRILSRLTNENTEIPYYKYYDMAMDRNAAFKPELIEMHSKVNNNNTENKFAIYNKGHLETQLTYFIGDVNYYYSINGQKYCIETNTGDSSIGLPYIPHTFTHRDYDEVDDDEYNGESKIIAVTFSNNLALNIPNLSYIKHNELERISGNMREINELLILRLERYLELNCMTKDELNDILIEKHKLNKNDVMEFINYGIYNEMIAKTLEHILNINYYDLKFNELKENEECIYQRTNDNNYRLYNGLLIKKLAFSKHIKNVGQFDIIISNKNKSDILSSSYYQFIYNKSNRNINIYWNDNNMECIQPNDSLIIHPFVKYQLEIDVNDDNNNNEVASLYLAKIPGVINENTLNEYALFDIENRYRLCDNENSVWW